VRCERETEREKKKCVEGGTGDVSFFPCRHHLVVSVGEETAWELLRGGEIRRLLEVL
jgi:hypothetical protein